MHTRGRHLIVEYTGCDRAILDDRERIQALMVRAAESARTTVVACLFKTFQPQGVTGVVVLEESHLSIHTWPEHSYAAVDFFTCGQGAPERAHEVLFEGLRAGRAERLLVHRGLGGSQPMIVHELEAQLHAGLESHPYDTSRGGAVPGFSAVTAKRSDTLRE